MNNKQPRVFVPQLPSRFDRATNLWIPSINIAPAEEHGVLVTLLPPNANRMHTAPLVAAMREKMEDFNENDSVVAVGDPALIMAAGIIAASKTGGEVNVLKWDKLSSQYLRVKLVV